MVGPRLVTVDLKVMAPPENAGLGIAAWLMANSDLEEMSRGYMDPSGRDLTNTGRILGMVSTGLLVTSLIIVLFFVLIPIVARH